MKKAITIILLLASTLVFADNCKPDVNATDKITKQTNIAWQAELFESNFGNSLVNTSSWRINFQIGRYTENNLLTVFLNKYEESTQAAAFESAYRGAEGNDVILAFTTGEPLFFTVTGAVNNTQMDNLNGRLVTTVTLSVALAPAQIEQVRKSFAAGRLSAVRCKLVNNMTVEQDVKEKRAEKLNEKVNCYFNYIDQHPVQAKAPSAVNSTAMMPVDENTHKITFSEVITDEANAPAKQLYDRAKRWMIDYYKDTQIKLDLPEEGKLSRSGSFIKSYNTNGKQANDEMLYSVTISVKDGKYKYTITDIIDNDGKTKMTAEAMNEMLKKIPAAVGNSLVQQFNEGFQEVASQLKAAMKADAKKSDW